MHNISSKGQKRVMFQNRIGCEARVYNSIVVIQAVTGWSSQRSKKQKLVK